MHEIKRNFKLFLDALLIGLITSMCAEIFLLLLDFISKYTLGLYAGYVPLDVIDIVKLKFHIFDSYHPFYAFLILIGGALVSGFLVYTFAPEAEGHGLDTLIRAFHRTGGYIRPIVVPVKILASAITIGTGGSAGRAGPTSLFSAGLGNLYARLRNAPYDEREMLVLLSVGAGLSAVSQSPLGSAFFAMEVLYLESEFGIVQLMIVLFGALIAYIIPGFLFGWHSIFIIPPHKFNITFGIYLLLILFSFFAAVLSIFIANFYYYTRDFFRAIPIKPHFKPALGAIVVGLIAIWYPQVLGGGYGWMQEAINASLTFKIMLILLFAKLVAFVFTVASGGSGGTFAPTLFIGIMFGGVFAYLLHLNVTLFVLLGMAALFAGTARTPLAAIIIITEMAKDYSLLVPTMFVVFFTCCFHNILVKLFKFKYITLYESQLINKNYSPYVQIEKLKEILICYMDLIKLSPKKIRNQEFLELLESGIPIKLPTGEYLYFGEILKNTKLKEINNAKYIKNLRVLYIFRNGEWLHPKEINEIYKGDEVLLLAKKEDIQYIKEIFVPVSQIFSRLKKQEKAIEELVNK